MTRVTYFPVRNLTIFKFSRIEVNLTTSKKQQVHDSSDKTNPTVIGKVHVYVQFIARSIETQKR